MNETAKNTDRELWRESYPDPPGDYYAPSIHVTEQGAIGINVGGTVYVKTLTEWHSLQQQLAEAQAQNERMRETLESLACYDDERANLRLDATGSYALFDEPGSVQAAREILKEVQEEGF